MKKLANRIEGLKDLAGILIREDKIMDAVPVLSDCWNGGISGNGAFSFMSELMNACNEKQAKQVAWLFDECMPNMHRGAMELLLKRRAQMHARFFDGKSVSFCNSNIQKNWKKQGKIRESFCLRLP